MKNLIILTGAGISEESGIKTFRDSNGLWENHDIMEVASPEGWRKNQALVLNFYNDRRKQLNEVEPNKGHHILKEFEKHFNVKIITQNVDDLHERAGSHQVLHLHGELKKVRSSIDENDIFDLDGWELKAGDLCKKGSQLRPHIVWFGEDVPKIDEAMEITKTADIFVVVGTSLNVYPAAGLLSYVPENCPIFLIDPQPLNSHFQFQQIQEKGSTGLEMLYKTLIK